MAQWVKVFAARPVDVSLIPWTTWWKERSDPVCCLLTSVYVAMHVHTQTNAINFILNQSANFPFLFEHL